MPNRQASPQELSPEEADRDRFPTVNQALRRIIEDARAPKGNVEAIHIRLHASGEVTYNILPARAEEWQGGYLPPS